MRHLALHLVLVLANLPAQYMLAERLGAQEPDSRVRVTGSAEVGPSVASTRQRAINDAIRRAVEQAAGLMISAETRVKDSRLLDDRILSRASGFVRNYEVISQSRFGEVLSVTILATVATEALYDDMLAVGLLLARNAYPRVAIRATMADVPSRGGGDLGWRDMMAGLLAASLSARGVPVVSDARNDSGRTAPAREDVEIRAQLSLGEPREVMAGIISRPGALTLDAVEPVTGRSIARTSVGSSNAGATEHQATTVLVNRLARDAGDSLMSHLFSSWSADANGGRALIIGVRGLKSADQYYRIRDRLLALFAGEGEASAKALDVASGTASFVLQQVTDPDALSTRIQRTSFAPDVVTVSQLGRGELQLTVRVKHRN
jgi:hypothetical protein